MDIPIFWRQRKPLSFCLLPLSWLFGLIIKIRKFLIKPQKLACPVLVVGNLTVGGNGKTPLVIALVKALRAKNLKVGVISRGYLGEKAKKEILIITKNHSAKEVGDEPLLIYQTCNCPVAVGKNRFEAGKLLLKNYPDLDLIISDDGLQHYRLARDFEIVAMAEDFLLANEFLLPAGALREPKNRLNSVNAIVISAGKELPSKLKKYQKPIFLTKTKAENFYYLSDKQPCDLDFLKFQKTVAVAGIARPERFFNSLAKLGIKTEQNIALGDHKEISQELLAQNLNFSFIITEKDAVKIADKNFPAIVLAYEAVLPSQLIDLIMKKLGFNK